MKSYIINIQLIGSEPLIWRKIIMPAGATFNRLNDVIQNVTNFLSGYPYDAYHLFEFDLGELIVTNDDEAYLEHKHYKNNKGMYEERLKSMAEEFLEFEIPYQERLNIEVRKPSTLKIDKYIEELKEIKYEYDFGEGWEFLVKLEDIVDDYHFGFPTLLDGAETAPPEDVGGPYGFYEFLKIYNDENHPEHEEAKAWSDSLFFREYNFKWINDRLRAIKYRKTEWDKINHNRYKIIDDKYRKE